MTPSKVVSNQKSKQNQVKFIGLSLIFGLIMVFSDGLRTVELKTSKAIAENTERVEQINNSLGLINPNEYSSVIEGLKSQRNLSQDTLFELKKEASGYSKIYLILILISSLSVLVTLDNLTSDLNDNTQN